MSQSPLRSSGASTWYTSLLPELELAAEQLEHFGGHVRVDLEPHRDAELRALPQHDFHRGEQVFGLVVELDVGVACDAERDDARAPPCRGTARRDARR